MLVISLKSDTFARKMIFCTNIEDMRKSEFRKGGILLKYRGLLFLKFLYHLSLSIKFFKTIENDNTVGIKNTFYVITVTYR